MTSPAAPGSRAILSFSPASVRVNRMNYRFRRSVRIVGVRLDIFTKQPVPRAERRTPDNGSTFIVEVIAVLAVLIAILLVSFR